MTPFEVLNEGAGTRARRGRLTTRRGVIETPVFMPVATQATVKAVPQHYLKDLGADIILSNTYHLYLRPGVELLEKAGGIQKFMDYHGAVLTDSGGFQVFSLSELRKIEAGGVTFQSHLDGSRHLFTPENVIDHQRRIGSDCWTVLDVCSPFPAERAEVRDALDKTKAWAERALKHSKAITEAMEEKDRPVQFGIVQGGMHADLRKEAVEHLVALDFPALAIGGLSVGEEKALMYGTLDETTPHMPTGKARYLMGVGAPEDLWEAVDRGVDMFDCVWPTRNARNGQVMTFDGKLQVKNTPYKDDFRPLDEECACPVCAKHSRAYICHLYRAREFLSHTLISVHNLWFLAECMRRMRVALENGTFPQAKKAFLDRYLKR